MLLASAYAEVDTDGSGGLRFVIQDRPVIVEMGEKAWRAKCRELLDSGAVRFHVHNFFTPRPVTDAAVFLLRVVLHDWPDAFAHRILLCLREAAAPHTKRVLANFVLPLAGWDGRAGRGRGEDARAAARKPRQGERERVLDRHYVKEDAHRVGEQTQVTFNGQERTLRGIVAARARRERLRILRCATRGRDGRNWERRGGRDGDGRAREQLRDADVWLAHQSYLPCGGARFGGGVVGARRPFGGSRAPMPPPPLKRAVALTSPPVQKKMPSPLSVAHSPSSPSRICLRIARLRPPPVQQQQQQHASSITRRIPQAPLRTQSRQLHPPAPSPVPWQPPPPSTMSPHLSLSRRSSPCNYKVKPKPEPEPRRRRRRRSSTRCTTSRGSESGLGGGYTYGYGLGSLLLHGCASGGALDFGVRRRQRGHGDSEGGDFNDELLSRRVSPVLLPARSVLAVAARIERGIPRTPSSDP
ncbi:hypothetical protein B0H14DRAFT_3142618 [Mycena olivaceomarginata]|nr:hypothetical protein B0H14DRAFT_3142618 [Mycena olivaceomarginata]